MVIKMKKDNIAEIEQINKLLQCFVVTAHPQKVYLFGSFATGKQRMDSDYDFYIVVDNEVDNLCELHGKLEAAVGFDRNRPLDILVVTEQYFKDKTKEHWPIERHVSEEGILLYERVG